MRRARVLVAVTAAVTALLLQATILGPLTVPIPVSLPAVLVAATALMDGPGVGIGFGFSLGLMADLSSGHPAGVLGLCWLGVGLICGLTANRNTVRHDVLVSAVVCSAATTVSTALLVLMHADGAQATDAFWQLLPTLVGDGLLALAVVPLTRRFLLTESLRAPHPVLADLTGLMGARRG